MNGVRLVMSLLLLALPALALPVVRTTRRPKWWAIVLAASLGAGFVLMEASLIHAALPVIFTALGLPELAAACRALGGHLFGAAPLFGAITLFLAFVTVINAMLGGIKTVRVNASLRRGAARADRAAIGGHEAALMPFSTQWAVALPGDSPQILISNTLVSTLRDPELNAVVQHEAAHLDHHHIRFLFLGRIVGSGLWFLPWIRRATTALTLALERWADDEASAGSPERREHVRSALRKLSQLAPSALASDRITALEYNPEDQEATALTWTSAASAVFPLALALSLTLVHHLMQVIEVASVGGG